MAPTLVTLADIRSAAARLHGSVLRTPLIPVSWGDPDRPLWLKPESLQVIGAFKVRGALNAISRLDDEQRGRGVVAYSSGNHAQAVAYAAARFGIEAHIVMPEETPQIKVDRTREHGANVVLCGIGQREVVAAELVERTGGTLIPPFDHPDVIAGQGTAGLEVAEDLPEVATVLIPVSGGGLASGIGTAVQALCPNAKIFGVEPELAADAAAGLHRGSRVEMSIEERNRTIADGLRSQPSELTFSHLQHVLTDILTVTEHEIRSAVAELASKGRLVVEPSGAVGLAAYRQHRTPSGPTVIIVSGGNIEPTLFTEILAASTAVGEHQRD
ncbi:threonine ammonia-lyase [Mycobacterium sp. C31M]